MHYFLIILLIVGIITLQYIVFSQNRKNLHQLKTIFPDNNNDLKLFENESFLEIQSEHSNPIFKEIISSINNYLRHNVGAISDYHLIKDIVDRNCDTKEDEIHSLVPVPLYLGLAGTMMGILIGVGFIVFSGGLHDLLIKGSGTGIEGIETLLGGVALAMISSIVGIILTTLGSQEIKDVKIEVEKNKNSFLSWLQAELLPNMSSNVADALIKLGQNLAEFNITFSKNTDNLKGILEDVTESYEIQRDLIKKIDELKINDIATANIEVYDKLKNSTNEIGKFAEYLSSVNEYLVNIQSLTKKLDEYEKRTQVIENAGNFFEKNEKWLADNIDNANLEIKGAIKRFATSNEEYLLKLQETLGKQILYTKEFEKLLEGVIKRIETSNIEYLSKLQESLSNQILDAGKFFEKWLAENIDKANLEIQGAIKRFATSNEVFLSKLKETLSKQILDFDNIVLDQQEKLKQSLNKLIELATESFSKMQQTFDNAIKEQQSAYQNKLNELSIVVDEIKNLTHIKEGIKEFSEATNRQNSKIEELTKEIRFLALARTEGSVISPTIKLPKRIKALILAGSSIFILSCLFYVTPLLIELIKKIMYLLF